MRACNAVASLRGALAHLDLNRHKRGNGSEPPRTKSGRPDRRYGRRYGSASGLT